LEYLPTGSNPEKESFFLPSPQACGKKILRKNFFFPLRLAAVAASRQGLFKNF